MIFGDVPVVDAEGLILAHSVRLPGGAFKKGRVLSGDDIRVLQGAQIETVSGARLEPDDVGEDEAAETVARAVCGPGLTLGDAFTGRCNIFAEGHGLAVIDSARVNQLNLLDEAMTLGTVAPHALVEAGKMVATVKVIPFAAARAVVERCVGIAGDGGPMLRLAPLEARTVGLIQTRLPGTRESVLDSTTGAVATRLAQLDGALAAEVRCAHDRAEVAQAVGQLHGRGCDVILIAGASAIVDRRDVVPAAVVEAGGAIDHFGMPVDPGNLLLLARLGEARVLGLPGCARSLKLNGFDWVLQRIFAGVEVTASDIMRMGAGGLLMEIPSRPLPRNRASPRSVARADDAVSPSGPPRIAAVVLAAGQSRRMGALNKLLIEVDGEPMVRRVASAALASTARPVVIVTGHEAERIRAALDGLDVTFAHNPDYAEGMSSSLQRGVEAFDPAQASGLDGAVVCLGDMPRTSADLIDRLIAGFDPLEGRAIGVPTYRGKRGNPVLWAARYFGEIRNLSGDVGARHLIGDHADAVYEVESPDHSVTIDVDTPEALDALRPAAAR